MSPFSIPDTGRQVFVAAFLAQARHNWLHHAVVVAAKSVDAEKLRVEIESFAPAEGLAALRGTGVRDEEVFATPIMLQHSPGILAYYRLLLGISQKQFYSTSTGLNVFRSMEDRQSITERAAPMLGYLCDSLNSSLSDLIMALPREGLKHDVRELPLLTLGAQADGSWRNKIGTSATSQVFDSLKDIVRGTGRKYVETSSSISLLNSSHREVTLALAPDPDIVIREEFPTGSVYKTAIEIKGGSDYSNIHNRVGEAEKSHQKARLEGAGDFWTIIDLQQGDPAILGTESPTTRQWFNLSEVLNRSGGSWEDLQRHVQSALGI